MKKYETVKYEMKSTTNNFKSNDFKEKLKKKA